MSRSLSLATLRVLRALLDEPATAHYGLELSESTGVKTGALYPILSRLEKDGWVGGEWEDVDEAVVGRRRRRYYRLTGVGEKDARQILAETAAGLAPPPRRVESPQPGWVAP